MRDERRSGRRYAIDRQVRYQIRGVRPALAGSGRSLNMSSGGVLFTTEHPLESGKLAVIEINWPVLLDHAKPLKLVTRGHIVWSDSAMAAMRIDAWEFRTQGSAGL